MQRNEVERIFEQEKEKFFRKQYKSDCPPIAIILGGQPACGKSTLIQIAQSDHPEQKFLTVNGDLYRQFHPEHDKLQYFYIRLHFSIYLLQVEFKNRKCYTKYEIISIRSSKKVRNV